MSELPESLRRAGAGTSFSTAVAGPNGFAQLTLTNAVDGHRYVTFGRNLIMVTNNVGQLTASDFLSMNDAVPERSAIAKGRGVQDIVS